MKTLMIALVTVFLGMNAFAEFEKVDVESKLLPPTPKMKAVADDVYKELGKAIEELKKADSKDDRDAAREVMKEKYGKLQKYLREVEVRTVVTEGAGLLCGEEQCSFDTLFEGGACWKGDFEVAAEDFDIEAGYGDEDSLRDIKVDSKKEVIKYSTYSYEEKYNSLSIYECD